MTWVDKKLRDEIKKEKEYRKKIPKYEAKREQEKKSYEKVIAPYEEKIRSMITEANKKLSLVEPINELHVTFEHQKIIISNKKSWPRTCGFKSFVIELSGNVASLKYPDERNLCSWKNYKIRLEKLKPDDLVNMMGIMTGNIEFKTNNLLGNERVCYLSLLFPDLVYKRKYFYEKVHCYKLYITILAVVLILLKIIL